MDENSQFSKGGVLSLTMSAHKQWSFEIQADLFFRRWLEGQLSAYTMPLHIPTSGLLEPITPPMTHRGEACPSGKKESNTFILSSAFCQDLFWFLFLCG